MSYRRPTRAFVKRKLMTISVTALPALSLCLSGCSGAKPKEPTPPTSSSTSVDAPISHASDSITDQGVEDMLPTHDGMIGESDMERRLPSNPKAPLYDELGF